MLGAQLTIGRERNGREKNNNETGQSGPRSEHKKQVRIEEDEKEERKEAGQGTWGPEFEAQKT